MGRAAFILMLFGAVSAVAQPVRVPPVRTVARLGSCTAHEPKTVAVTDGLTSSDCTAGGGIRDVICHCRDGAWSAAATTVSVGLSVPDLFTVTGSPVTGSGTLAVAFEAQPANTVLAGPVAGEAAAPTFRVLTAADGTIGPSGETGANGATWSSGTSVPGGEIGANGDYYFRTSTDDVYLKSAGSWSIIANIRGSTGQDGSPGAPGEPGSPGAAGTDGKTVRSGAGAPSSVLGVDGDFYVDTSTQMIYGPKEAGAWGSGTSLAGTDGADGIPRTIQDEGVDLTQRLKVNFVGPGVTCADNPGASRTDCAVVTPAHAATHAPGGADPLAVDAAAGTGSLRTLGTGVAQAAAGNDARFTDSRAPTAHATAHQPGGSDPLSVDAGASTGSLRTLGTGASQAASGSDSRFSDARTPTAHASSHKNGGADEVGVATSTTNGIPKAGASGKLDVGWLPVFLASGTSHAAGAVPDPGASAGTMRFLREDASFAVPAGLSAIADEGSALTQQTTLNLIGSPITCVNNAGASRTDCTVAAVAGPSSSTANAVATYSGTTGAILNNNSGVTIPTAGNVLLTGTIGLTAFDSTHATIQTGSDRNSEQSVRIVRGDQGASAGLVAHSIQLGGTGATSTTDHMLFFDGARNELTMTGLLGFAAGIAPFANADVAVTRLSAGYLSVDDGRTQNGLGKARAAAVRLMPSASPPVTCAAGTEGTQYYDTSHALCVCGASAWINLTPSDGGSCS